MILDDLYSYITQQTSQDISSAGLHVISDPETRSEIRVVSQPGAVYMTSPMSDGQMPGILQAIFTSLDELSPQSISRLGLHLIVDPDTREEIRVIRLPEAIYIESPQMISELPAGIPWKLVKVQA